MLKSEKKYQMIKISLKCKVGKLDIGELIGMSN